MTTRPFRYDKEEFARRGNGICETQVRPQIEEDDRGKIVAIDIETEAFELASNTVPPSGQLLGQYPDAQIGRVRIGHKAVNSFGMGHLQSLFMMLGIMNQTCETTIDKWSAIRNHEGKPLIQLQTENQPKHLYQ